MARLRLGSAGRGFAFVLSGGLAAQVVALAALPFLSRLYSPDDFGFLAVVLALTTLVAPAATLRFETAAMLPDDDERVRALVWNALLAVTIIASLYGFVLLAIPDVFAADYAGSRAIPMLTALSVVLAGAFAVLSQLALRKQEYGLVAKRTLWRAIATAGVQLALAFTPASTYGLVAGTVAGSAAGLGSLIPRTREYLRLPRLSSLGRVWREYWRFPVMFAPSALLNALGLQLPLLFLTFWFGLEAGGQLGMAERVVVLPLALVGAALSQVIDAEISKRIRDGNAPLLPGYLRLSALLGGLGALVAVGFGLLGGAVIPWILGEQWRTAGVIVQVLAVTSGVRLLASPLTRYLLLLQESAANAIIDALRVGLMALAVVAVATLDLELVPAVWAVYSSLTITYALTWLLGFSLVRRRDARQATGDDDA
ncbi:oligosaccharide flippase family protein [Agrococcus sp. TF02-05]|uniref:oligosaccharide flippase family protein n=1 Tax=Agrococcus sp. TF02-05 TaxID=2815211 RepID=UPI001AA0EEF1|nr:oligosaccharide flippase family protein [Agrococcus sp. TF02-05]MBO1769490.1 oligosaccharide flippase family protein [Agrococcus sp. TF02-05]